MNQTQSNDLASIKVSQFYYSDCMADLIIGQALGIASKGNQKVLNAGTFVCNYANHMGNYYVQIGIATGNTKDQSADQFWPTWQKQSVVFEVHWLSAFVQVPDTYFKNQRQSMPNSDIKDIIEYVLINS